MTSDSVGYEYKELGECIDLVIDHRGKTPKKLNSDWVDEGIPTISAKNVNSGKLVAQDSIRFVNHEVYKKWMKEDVQPGDCFLVSEGATLGECLYWDNDYPIVLGQRIFCIRTNPEVLYPRYFYAYMTSAAFQSEIIGRATGSSVPGLRQTEVLKLKVKMLPMVQQIFIGDLLHSINTKIKTSVETNQTLEQIAQAIFKSWFVDFEPTRAKIAAKQNGQNPERAAMAAISGKSLEELDLLSPEQQQQLKVTAVLFPDTLVESEFGKIPEGWGVKSMEELSIIVAMGPFGSNIKIDTFVDDGVPVISGQHLKGIMLEDNEFNFITFEHAKKLGKANVQRGDVVFTHAGSIGQVACIPYNSRYDRYVLSQRQFYMRPNLDLISPLYIVSFFKSHIGQYELLANTSQVGVPSISRPVSNLRKINTVVPNKLLMDQFHGIIGSMFNEMSLKKNESLSLKIIRDSLLPKLLSGQLPIKAPQPKPEAAC